MRTQRTPTQLELATLAAALPSGKAQERVILAAEIWREAGNYAEDLEIMARTEKLTAESHKTEWQTLDKLLRDAMPKCSNADRFKAYRDFLTDQIRLETGAVYAFDDSHSVKPAEITDDQAAAIAANRITEQRVSGIIAPAAQLVAFRGWLTRRADRNKSERARKGGIGKSAKNE